MLLPVSIDSTEVNGINTPLSVKDRPPVPCSKYSGAWVPVKVDKNYYLRYSVAMKVFWIIFFVVLFLAVVRGPGSDNRPWFK